jgi:hypothetical protein
MSYPVGGAPEASLSSAFAKICAFYRLSCKKNHTIPFVLVIAATSAKMPPGDPRQVIVNHNDNRGRCCDASNAST